MVHSKGQWVAGQHPDISSTATAIMSKEVRKWEEDGAQGKSNKHPLSKKEGEKKPNKKQRDFNR